MLSLNILNFWNKNNGDGLSDGAEVLKYGTNPLNPDTDGDLLIDGHNVSGWSEVSWSYVKKNTLMCTLS